MLFKLQPIEQCMVSWKTCGFESTVVSGLVATFILKVSKTVTSIQMPLINESLKYSKENPSRDHKPKILGFQNNGGCLFPSYHAQKQNLAESETKDFGLPQKEAKQTTGFYLLQLLSTETLPGAAQKRIPPCCLPREIGPSGGSF